MILVTGGTGYIGSHLCIELKKLGYDIISLDNIDIRNFEKLNFIFENDIDTVIHLAARTSIPESILYPIDYYDNNVVGTLNLLKCMEKHNVKKFIFTSTASVYADGINFLNENSPLMPLNPYAKSKYMVEKILHDLKDWNILVLRLFNVVGGNNSSPHLFPSIMKVIHGTNEKLKIFGDGTAIRDYVHISDVVNAYIAGLKIMDKSGIQIFNIGRGKGNSVLEIVDTFEMATNKKIARQFLEGRKNEMLRCVADITMAGNELEWTPEFDMYDIVMSYLKNYSSDKYS